MPEPVAAPPRKKKSRNKPPPPLDEAEGRSHTIVERPGREGQYTTHYENGTFKQYRGSGKPHGKYARPNIKFNKINTHPGGVSSASGPIVRYPTDDEYPK
nr:polymorphic toxin type 24 domain-containing protein [Pseudomonas californiensis]